MVVGSRYIVDRSVVGSKVLVGKLVGKLVGRKVVMQ